MSDILADRPKGSGRSGFRFRRGRGDMIFIDHCRRATSPLFLYYNIQAFADFVNAPTPRCAPISVAGVTSGRTYEYFQNFILEISANQPSVTGWPFGAPCYEPARRKSSRPERNTCTSCLRSPSAGRRGRFRTAHELGQPRREACTRLKNARPTSVRRNASAGRMRFPRPCAVRPTD
jgi:hypothetical protein